MFLFRFNKVGWFCLLILPSFHEQASSPISSARAHSMALQSVGIQALCSPIDRQTALSSVSRSFQYFKQTPNSTSSRRSCVSIRSESEGQDLHDLDASIPSSRRSLLVAGSGAILSNLILGVEPSDAVKQNLLAGRIPGLSPPDKNGLRTYRRPDTKSGGHGVGWSPIIPYSFKVPNEWEEVPVSIADLGGTEIDLRFANAQEGNISVVVAPVLRFSIDLGDNVTIEKIGPPDKVIYAFGPELVGQNVEGRVKDMEVTEHEERTYYLFELESPHVFVTATAAGNRLYLMTVSANARQWKKHASGLKQIAQSFRVG